MRIFSLIIAVSLIFFLSACIKTTDIRGYTADHDARAMIKPGVSTREQVAGRLGSPSTISSLGGETWYYITQKSAYIAFLDPKVVDQEVYAVTFNPQGVVSEIKTYKAEDKNDVDFASDTTPTAGHDMGIAEQLLGNVGRFNPADQGPHSRYGRM